MCNYRLHDAISHAQKVIYQFKFPVNKKLIINIYFFSINVVFLHFRHL